MAKKDKPPASVTSGALKHNPFAALAGPSTQAPAAKPEGQAVATAASVSDAPRTSPEPRAHVAPAPATPRPSAHEKGKSRGRLVLRRETKHRGGKAVIIVTGFAGVRDFDAAQTEALAKQLKQQLGCGGTVEGTGETLQIVLQGDRAAKVAELLRGQGFRVDGVTS